MWKDVDLCVLVCFCVSLVTYLLVYSVTFLRTYSLMYFLTCSLNGLTEMRSALPIWKCVIGVSACSQPPCNISWLVVCWLQGPLLEVSGIDNTVGPQERAHHLTTQTTQHVSNNLMGQFLQQNNCISWSSTSVWTGSLECVEGGTRPFLRSLTVLIPTWLLEDGGGGLSNAAHQLWGLLPTSWVHVSSIWILCPMTLLFWFRMCAHCRNWFLVFKNAANPWLARQVISNDSMMKVHCFDLTFTWFRFQFSVFFVKHRTNTKI